MIYGFRVRSSGDSSVGINGWDVDIDIDGNEGDVDTADIYCWKEFLADYYDVGIKYVYTKTEWDTFLKFENELEESMYKPIDKHKWKYWSNKEKMTWFFFVGILLGIGMMWLTALFI